MLSSVQEGQTLTTLHTQCPYSCRATRATGALKICIYFNNAHSLFILKCFHLNVKL